MQDRGINVIAGSPDDERSDGPARIAVMRATEGPMPTAVGAGIERFVDAADRHQAFEPIGAAARSAETEARASPHVEAGYRHRGKRLIRAVGKEFSVRCRIDGCPSDALVGRFK